MVGGLNGGVQRQVHSLFGRGTLVGMDAGLLLERFVSRNDELAFEALVARFGPMVLGICRRMLDDPRDVEDTFQATFLIFVRKAATIRDGGLLGNWLYGVAFRVATRARVHGRRNRLREVPATERVAMAPMRPDEGDARELQVVLDEELERLPARFREVIMLCCLQGQTYEEAASRLKCPVGTVRSRLSGARDLLRTRLVRRGIVIPAGSLAAVLAPSATNAAVPPGLYAATIRAAFPAAHAAASAGAVSVRVAILTREVMTGMALVKTTWIAGLSSILAVAGGWAMVGPPAGNVVHLRARIATSQEPDRDLDGREGRPLQLAMPVNAAADSVALKKREVARAVGRLADQVRSRSLPPRAGQGDLFLLDTVTNEVREIAGESDTGLTWRGTPSWSWDGSRILFDASRGKDYSTTRLKMIDLTDEGIRFSDLGRGNCPSLSPDGRTLAIMDNPGRGVAIMRTDGTERRRVGPYGQPKWAPDGRRFLIIGLPNPCPVWLTSPDGSFRREFHVEGQQNYLEPSWVTETTIVAVLGPNRAETSIALVDVSEAAHPWIKRVLWKRGRELDVMPAFPVYSADTGRLVFAGADARGRMALYACEDGQSGPPKRVEPTVDRKDVFHLAGSPDGRYVLFNGD